MSFNYCPNCGHALTHSALASNPPIPIVECSRCGWEMREGRAPSWNTGGDSTAVPIQTEFTCVIDPNPRVPPEHKMLREEEEE